MGSHSLESLSPYRIYILYFSEDRPERIRISKSKLKGSEEPQLEAESKKVKDKVNMYKAP